MRREESTNEIADFRDLIVWRRAMELAKGVYLVTRHFPPDERFGLTNQVRRAAVSMSSNIAEGHARKFKANYYWLWNFSLLLKKRSTSYLVSATKSVV